MSEKKHPCPDCLKCQWCSDTRCSLCLRPKKSCRRKLSQAEQIALYERLNRARNEVQIEAPARRRVLFICSDGSCLGPMAAHLTNHDFADRLQALHASLEPQGLRPQTRAVLAEIGIDASTSKSLQVSRYERDSFHIVIALDDESIEKAPLYFAGVRRYSLHFAAPDRDLADEQETLSAFCATRDALRRQLRDFFRTQ